MTLQHALNVLSANSGVTRAQRREASLLVRQHINAQRRQIVGKQLALDQKERELGTKDRLFRQLFDAASDTQRDNAKLRAENKKLRALALPMIVFTGALSK